MHFDSYPSALRDEIVSARIIYCVMRNKCLYLFIIVIIILCGVVPINSLQRFIIINKNQEGFDRNKMDCSASHKRLEKMKTISINQSINYCGSIYSIASFVSFMICPPHLFLNRAYVKKRYFNREFAQFISK